MKKIEKNKNQYDEVTKFEPTGTKFAECTPTKKEAILKKKICCCLAASILCGSVGLTLIIVKQVKTNSARETQNQILQKYDYDTFNEEMRQQKIDKDISETSIAMDPFNESFILVEDLNRIYAEAASYNYNPAYFAEENATKEEWKQYQAAQKVCDDTILNTVGGALLGLGCGAAVGTFVGNKVAEDKEKNKMSKQESVKGK